MKQKIIGVQGGSDFPHKKGGVGNIGGCFKKGVLFIFILPNLFKCYLSLKVWCVCVLFLYNIFIGILCFTGRT